MRRTEALQLDRERAEERDRRSLRGRSVRSMLTISSTRRGDRYYQTSAFIMLICARVLRECPTLFGQRREHNTSSDRAFRDVSDTTSAAGKVNLPDVNVALI